MKKLKTSLLLCGGGLLASTGIAALISTSCAKNESLKIKVLTAGGTWTDNKLTVQVTNMPNDVTHIIWNYTAFNQDGEDATSLFSWVDNLEQTQNNHTIQVNTPTDGMKYYAAINITAYVESTSKMYIGDFALPVYTAPIATI